MKQVKLSCRSGWMGFWPSGGFKAILRPDAAFIRLFIEEKINLIDHGGVVLDAGAGKKPYKNLFTDFNYQSTDMPGGFYNEEHDFECYLHDIPQPDCSYDAVLLNHVIEHVPNPSLVLAEIQRVLKPGGLLIMSFPLNAPLHGEPWHFYNFSHYALADLANEIGYEIKHVEKIGGGFWLLGKLCKDIFIKLFKQHDPFRAKKRNQNFLAEILKNFLLLPIYFLAYIPSAFILRPVFYWMDKLDIMKEYTMGYVAVLQKENFSHE